MSAKRKLVPAVVLLFVSAIILSTASYAWFSVNTTVIATGMTVSAKSNATHLLIDTVDNKTDKTSSDVIKSALYPNATVYPAAYFEGGSKSVGSLRITGNNIWYTANNSNFDDASNDVINAKVIEQGDSDYMLTNTFYLSLAANSLDYAEDIEVSFTREAGCDNAVSALVVIGEGTDILNLVFDGNTTTKRYSCASNHLTSTTSLKVTVYTYINGESENVNSAYISNGNIITGSISITFSLVPPLNLPTGTPETPESPPYVPTPESP